MVKEFGNNWNYFKKLLLFSLALGVVVAGLMAWVLIRQNQSDRLVNALVAGLVTGGAIPLFTSPTLLFSLRIGDGVIAHVLCRRWMMKRRLLADLTKVELGFGAGAKFHFKDGSTITFIGADVGILDEMCRYIHELRPEFTHFLVGSRMAMILKTTQFLRSRMK